MITIAEITEKLKSYLEELGYSQSSCSMIPACVKDFLEYSRKAVEAISKEDIESYHSYLQIRPHKRHQGALSEKYIDHHLYSLRIFFNWLETTEEISHNPISALKFKSPKINTRHPLPLQEIEALFQAAETLKERAILHLFYSCGLRRTEAVNLNIKDLLFRSQLLYVRKGKGAKRRVVPVTSKVASELESYYQEERSGAEKINDAEAFMVNSSGRRLCGNGYNRILKGIIARTTTDGATSLHHLRHSIATHLLQGGLQVEQVRIFLGHSHLESTQGYTKVSEQQLSNL